MSRPTSEIGYRYVLALCDAIETYLKDAKKKDSQVFTYRGSPLEYALSRTLYSSFATHARLTEEYARTGILTLPHELTNRKRLLRTIAGWLLRASGCQRLIRFIRTFATPTLVNGAPPKILLCIESERFARFMEPIARQIQTPYAYLTYNEDAAAYLKSVGLPCISISSSGKRIMRLAQKESLLSRFGIIEKYDLLEDTFRRIRPMSVVVIEGNAAFDETVNQLAKKYGAASICIQQGWSPIMHNGFRNMSYTKMLMWGDGFSKLLAPYNPHQHFVSTGNHCIELADRASKNKGEKIIIGFLPQRPTNILTKECFNEFLDLIPWAAHTFKNAEIRVSEHPTVRNTQKLQELSSYKNVAFVSSRTHSLQEIIGGNDVSLSIYSSTILESIAVGSIPLIVNVTSMPRYSPDVANAGAGIEVHSAEEARIKLAELVSPGALEPFRAPMKKFREEYFARGGDEALRAIVHEIEHP